MLENKNVQVRKYSEPILKQVIRDVMLNRVDVLTRLVIGFAMLSPDERDAIMMLGHKGSHKVQAGYIFNIDKGWSEDESIIGVYDEK